MDLISRARKWVSLQLAAFSRAPGRRRAVCPAASTPRTLATAPARVTARPAKPTFDAPEFRDPVFDGERDMVRPYVLLHQRRRALELALDGIDLGPRWIHGVEVAR